PWWLLVAFALAPDLSLGGYLAGQRVGSAIYNAAHTYVPPVVLGAVGVITGRDLAVQLGLIWITHIGVDRACGYGLKYPRRSRRHTCSASAGRGTTPTPSPVSPP